MQLYIQDFKNSEKEKDIYLLAVLFGYPCSNETDPLPGYIYKAMYSGCCCSVAVPLWHVPLRPSVMLYPLSKTNPFIFCVVCHKVTRAHTTREQSMDTGPQLTFKHLATWFPTNDLEWYDCLLTLNFCRVTSRLWIRGLYFWSSWLSSLIFLACLLWKLYKVTKYSTFNVNEIYSSKLRNWNIYRTV